MCDRYTHVKTFYPQPIFDTHDTTMVYSIDTIKFKWLQFILWRDGMHNCGGNDKNPSGCEVNWNN